jgi:hypothetical protein
MVIERHRRRDVCVIHSYDQDVKGGVIGAAEKARWQSEDAQVVIPVCCTEPVAPSSISGRGMRISSSTMPIPRVVSASV